MKIYPLLLVALLGLSQCKKKSDPAPVDQLPPATQTGANTFGCLLNSQAWTPSGNDGTENYRVTYDPTYHGGNLSIRVYRYIGDTGKFQSFLIGGDQINQTGSYSFITSSTFPTPGPRNIYFFDGTQSRPCNDYGTNPGTTTKGQLVVTRLDLTAGIISGTFAFTLYQPGCDSVRVTQGRFDKKL